MYTYQGEPSLRMKADLVSLQTPGFGGMAAQTVFSELPPMIIGVAVNAGRTDVRKRQSFVTVSAVGVTMRPEKLEPGFLVLEGRRTFHGFPRVGCMTNLAIPFQLAMRILA